MKKLTIKGVAFLKTNGKIMPQTILNFNIESIDKIKQESEFNSKNIQERV